MIDSSSGSGRSNRRLIQLLVIGRRKFRVLKLYMKLAKSRFQQRRTNTKKVIKEIFKFSNRGIGKFPNLKKENYQH